MIAFEGAADGGNNGGGSGHTFSYAVSSNANRLLVVGFAGDDNSGADDITGVTYNGVAMTLALKQVSSGAENVNRFSYVYYLLGPASGTHNVVISTSGSHYILAGAADYSGVKQTAQPDNTTTQVGGGGTSLTTSLSTVADNCWVVLFEQDYSNGGQPSAGTGATSRTSDGAFGTWGLFDSNGPITPAGSYSMTTTRPDGGVSDISHVLVSFAPAAAAAAVSGSFFPLMRGGG